MSAILGSGVEMAKNKYRPLGWPVGGQNIHFLIRRISSNKTKNIFFLSKCQICII